MVIGPIFVRIMHETSERAERGGSRVESLVSAGRQQPPFANIHGFDAGLHTSMMTEIDSRTQKEQLVSRIVRKLSICSRKDKTRK